MFVIAFRGSMSTFSGTLFKISIYEIPTCFASRDETERLEFALKTSTSMPALEVVFINSPGTSSILVFILSHSTTQPVGFPLRL